MSRGFVECADRDGFFITPVLLLIGRSCGLKGTVRFRR